MQESDARGRRLFQLVALLRDSKPPPAAPAKSWIKQRHCHAGSNFLAPMEREVSFGKRDVASMGSARTAARLPETAHSTKPYNQGLLKCLNCSLASRS